MCVRCVSECRNNLCVGVQLCLFRACAPLAGGVDALVVDEAAQATEAEVVVALQMRPSKCLLVGDPCAYGLTMLCVCVSSLQQTTEYSTSVLRRLLQRRHRASCTTLTGCVALRHGVCVCMYACMRVCVYACVCVCVNYCGFLWCVGQLSSVVHSQKAAAAGLGTFIHWVLVCLFRIDVPCTCAHEIVVTGACAALWSE